MARLDLVPGECCDTASGRRPGLQRRRPAVAPELAAHAGDTRCTSPGRTSDEAGSLSAPSNKRLKLTAHVEWNDYFFFNAPQLRRDPLGSSNAY